MNGNPDAGGVLAWIAGIISVIGALYATGRRIFSTVTRSELSAIIEAQDKKFLDALEVQRQAFDRAIDREEETRQSQHAENRDAAKETFERLSAVEKGVSRIEGQLSQRFQQRPDRR